MTAPLAPEELERQKNALAIVQAIHKEIADLAQVCVSDPRLAYQRLATIRASADRKVATHVSLQIAQHFQKVPYMTAISSRDLQSGAATPTFGQLLEKNLAFTKRLIDDLNSDPRSVFGFPLTTGPQVPVSTGGPSAVSVTKKTRDLTLKELFGSLRVPELVGVVVVFLGAVGGAYTLGRQHEAILAPDHLKNLRAENEALRNQLKASSYSSTLLGGTDRLFAEADKLAESLRLKHSVRELRDVENELRLKDLPNGILGFMPAYSGVLNPDKEVLRKRDAIQTLEVHKLPDGTSLVIIFASQGEALRLETAAGEVETQVFSVAFEEATVPVLV
jgi:hypothetical protein